MDIGWKYYHQRKLNRITKLKTRRWSPSFLIEKEIKYCYNKLKLILNELIDYLEKLEWRNWKAEKIFENLEILCSGDLEKIKEVEW